MRVRVLDKKKLIAGGGGNFFSIYKIYKYTTTPRFSSPFSNLFKNLLWAYIVETSWEKSNLESRLPSYKGSSSIRKLFVSIYFIL